MISIICVYNDRATFKKYLVKSLREQTVKFELIEIDNRENVYSSAAEALNTGANEAQGRYLMFVHQDICFESKTWLQDAENLLDTLDSLGAAGVAGRAEGETTNTASVDHGVPRKFVGNKHLTLASEVQTLDECLIITSRDVFSKYKFDDIICDDWHLYGVDLCLRMKKDLYRNYVLPLPTYHHSLGRKVSNIFEIVKTLGSLPSGYIYTVEKILKRHQGTFKKVFTTCGNWRTDWPVLPQRILYVPKDVARYCFWFFRQSLHNFRGQR